MIRTFGIAILPRSAAMAVWPGRRQNAPLRKKHGTVRANGVRKPPERKRKIKQANPAGRHLPGAAMPEKPQSQSLAILIDADNTSARHAHAIFEEIVKLG